MERQTSPHILVDQQFAAPVCDVCNLCTDKSCCPEYNPSNCPGYGWLERVVSSLGLHWEKHSKKGVGG
jgi:hypothetical protein